MYQKSFYLHRLLFVLSLFKVASKDAEKITTRTYFVVFAFAFFVVVLATGFFAGFFTVIAEKVIVLS